ncbi:MAG: sulfoxide reductase heme-binding subunit YedZ [Gammaproteobacteria bacterium]|nr:sulfoxide reductase heme-binding subunit YedZ [Gammaproteobacteria bacterium]
MLPATYIKPVLHLACAVPALMLAYGLYKGDLGFNPVETLTHQTGLWSLRLLLISLAMTPLRRMTARVEFIQQRRMFGLWAFFYACVHFTIYLLLDLSLDFSALWADIVKRPYITVGFIAFVLLLPLAFTSTLNARRRLGRKWNTLHKLVYAIGVTALLHFWWIQKADIREPLIYCLIFGALMLFRLPLRGRKR